MILTKEQIEKFNEAAKPLVRALNEECHPYVKILVESTGFEILEGLSSRKIEEFLQD